VHVCRHTGTEQGLQGRLVRATQNNSSNAFPAALGASGFAAIDDNFDGWFDFPKGVARQVDISSYDGGRRGDDSSEGKNPGTYVRPWMSVAQPSKARIQRGYRYALELCGTRAVSRPAATGSGKASAWATGSIGPAALAAPNLPAERVPLPGHRRRPAGLGAAQPRADFDQRRQQLVGAPHEGQELPICLEPG